MTTGAAAKRPRINPLSPCRPILSRDESVGVRTALDSGRGFDGALLRWEDDGGARSPVAPASGDGAPRLGGTTVNGRGKNPVVIVQESLEDDRDGGGWHFYLRRFAGRFGRED
jgi:hypothetical protein